MLNRQKCLLLMIQRAGRPVTHFELTKWAFLVAYDTPSRGGPAFYQFLPYHYGPFSFCLFRESDALVRDGHLLEEEKSWRIAEDVVPPVTGLPARVREDATEVVERFAERAPGALTDYVYQRFPWFTLKSKVRTLCAPPAASPAVYTVGYEGWQVDGFLNLLLKAGIRRLIDVRNNPVARRYGFHKASLRRLGSRVEIDYEHFPQLGVPSEWRRGLHEHKDYAALFARYEREVLPAQTKALKNIRALVSDTPSALLCFEADPQRCHRSRLAKAIAETASLPVRNLGA